MLQRKDWTTECLNWLSFCVGDTVETRRLSASSCHWCSSSLRRLGRETATAALQGTGGACSAAHVESWICMTAFTECNVNIQPVILACVCDSRMWVGPGVRINSCVQTEAWFCIFSWCIEGGRFFFEHNIVSLWLRVWTLNVASCYRFCVHWGAVWQEMTLKTLLCDDTVIDILKVNTFKAEAQSILKVVHIMSSPISIWDLLSSETRTLQRPGPHRVSGVLVSGR